MGNDLPQSVQFVKGVGPARAKTLQNLGIETIRDLFYYFPRDYEDRSKIRKIKYISPGSRVTVRGKVLKIEESRTGKGISLLRVAFSDGTDVLNGVWFNQSYLKKQFKRGKGYILSGEVNTTSWRKYKKKEINNPVFERADNGEVIHTGRVVPLYSLTEGLTQKRLRQIMYNALNNYVNSIKDVLPLHIREKNGICRLAKALRGIHFPRDRQHYIEARKRLVFEELFLLQLKMLAHKKEITDQTGIAHPGSDGVIEDFVSSLSFELTSAQQKVWGEIKADMERDVPMQRLLQGDVGSGKTVVAALALLKTMSGGYQGVFMAPTEILAEQHYLNLDKLLGPLGYRTALLVGGLKNKQRERIEREIAASEVDLIIGTHALFQESIDYNRIGLLVIDEQHRFGVEQRHRLKKKGENPDLLVMTATPIPRSMALTLYGDLDLSIIDELPPGRSPVITTWRGAEARDRIYGFVREKLREGRQAFVVCPLIEPSEELDLISAQRAKKEISEKYLRDFNVGLLHGRLEQAAKKKVMEDFRQGRIDVLVATTVVEVGVDVPNASLMIVEDAARFGLAQLHQLRGRVGRGKHQSYCILIADPATEEGRRRLKVITGSGDGFKIAEEDLKIRGPGEFFGTRQHGLPDLKIADLLKDKKMLRFARRQARKTLQEDEWDRKYPELAGELEKMEIKL